jgi:hypothetical protein
MELLAHIDALLGERASSPSSISPAAATSCEHGPRTGGGRVSSRSWLQRQARSVRVARGAVRPAGIVVSPDSDARHERDPDRRVGALACCHRGHARIVWSPGAVRACVYGRFYGSFTSCANNTCSTWRRCWRSSASTSRRLQVRLRAAGAGFLGHCLSAAAVQSVCRVGRGSHGARAAPAHAARHPRG